MLRPIRSGLDAFAGNLRGTSGEEAPSVGGAHQEQCAADKALRSRGPNPWFFQGNWDRGTSGSKCKASAVRLCLSVAAGQLLERRVCSR